VVPAADAWVRAINEAADKGDHKPAKDLLMHTGTIERLDEDGRGGGPLMITYVGVSLPGIPVLSPDGVSRPYFVDGTG